MRIEHVHFMPKVLKPGILYVSKEYKTAAHLCACGCGAKIRTPLTPTEWTLEETESGPTLRPSIGNWQQRCQSHYWIIKGQILWSETWTQEEILAGRAFEEKRRREYYQAKNKQGSGLLYRILKYINDLFNK